MKIEKQQKKKVTLVFFEIRMLQTVCVRDKAEMTRQDKMFMSIMSKTTLC